MNTSQQSHIQSMTSPATADIFINGIEVINQVPFPHVLRFCKRTRPTTVLEKSGVPGTYKLQVFHSSSVTPSTSAFNMVVEWMNDVIQSTPIQHTKIPRLQPKVNRTHDAYLRELTELYAAAIIMEIQPDSIPVDLTCRMMDCVSDAVLSAKDMQFIWDRFGWSDGGRVAQRMVTAYHKKVCRRRTPLTSEDDAIIDYCTSQPGLDEVFYEIGASEAEWAVEKAQAAFESRHVMSRR